MPNHEQESHAGEESSPLELNKETLRDLDVEATGAEVVKGGGSVYYVQPQSMSYVNTSNVGMSGSRITSGPVPSGGAATTSVPL